jgi:hypothetical protein
MTASEQALVTQFFKAGLIPSNVDMPKYITTQFNDTVSGDKTPS